MKYKDGDLVVFASGGLTGTAIVRGLSHHDLPVVGAGYIVEAVECTPAIPNEVYPYKFFVVFESFIKGKKS